MESREDNVREKFPNASFDSVFDFVTKIREKTSSGETLYRVGTHEVSRSRLRAWKTDSKSPSGKSKMDVGSVRATEANRRLVRYLLRR